MGQLVGVGATAVYVLLISTAAWLVLKYTMGLRVSAEEEMEGLDIGEHGMYAYPAPLVTEGFGSGTPTMASQAAPDMAGHPAVSASH